MSDSSHALDSELAALADDYDVIGELSAGPRSSFLLAEQKRTDGKRREDRRRVLIEVVRTPEGDEAHALEQLASDAKLLSTLRHRRLVPVLESRWLGADALAVVREHLDDPTVADLLARGQPFTNTRTAAILREVHGLLQWAREQSVVHRCVGTNRVFLEPMSDRVRVAFAAGPLPRIRALDAATDDVRTVVKLARAMLVGRRPDEETEGLSFAELRPDLPDRLHEETERLLTEPATDAELTLYLALIGMADPVAEGETERDRIRAEILEEQRVEREKLANERADLERLATEERRRLADEGEELRAAFAKEKARLEREFGEAQKQLEEERQELRRRLAEERAELLAKREALERELAERIAEVERAADADRANVEALRASIRMAGEAELERKRAAALEEIDDSEIRLDTGRFAIPAFVAPKLAPMPGVSFRRADPFVKAGAVEEPVVPAEPRLVVKVVRKLREPRRTPLPWRRWAARGGVAAAIVLAAVSAVLVESGGHGFADPLGVLSRTRGGSRAPQAAAPAARTSPATAPAAPLSTGAPTYTSSGGSIGSAPPASSATAGVAKADSLGTRADSVAAVPRTPVSRTDSLAARLQPSTPRTTVPSAARAESLAVQARRDSLRRAALRARAAARIDSAQRPAAAESRNARSTRLDVLDIMRLRDSLAGGSDSSSQ